MIETENELKPGEPVIDDPNESTDDIKAHIAQLNEKLKTAEELEDGETPVEPIEMPVADIMLKLDSRSIVMRKNVTPAEVLLLVAEHHPNAKEQPVQQCTKTGTRRVDPRAYKLELLGRFRAEKVEKHFPGTLPTYPKSFRSAMNIGIGTFNPRVNLMDFDVATSPSPA